MASSSQSNNYHALVAQIMAARAAVQSATNGDEILLKLQEALDHFDTLSGDGKNHLHHPMTPLLWMQYAYDAVKFHNMTAHLEEEENENDDDSDDDDTTVAPPALEYDAPFQPPALEAGLTILETAIQEFPGCSVLYLLQAQWWEKLWNLKKDTLSREREPDYRERRRIIEYEDFLDKWSNTVASAFSPICEGSHRNEGVVVREIWRQWAVVHLYWNNHDDASESVRDIFGECATYPMNLDLHSSVQAHYETFVNKYSTEASPLQGLPLAQCEENAVFAQFYIHEDDITVAMQQENILSPLLSSTEGWQDAQQLILESNLEEQTSWMGNGGLLTALAFIRFAEACSCYEDSNADAQSTITNLDVYIYERGIAECPTVEVLWLAYLNHLHQISLETAKKVADRAVRHCPYSIALAERRLNLLLLLVRAGKASLGPNEIFKYLVLSSSQGGSMLHLEILEEGDSEQEINLC